MDKNEEIHQNEQVDADQGIEVVESAPDGFGGNDIDAVNWSGLDTSYHRPAKEIEIMEDFDLSSIANDITNHSIPEGLLVAPAPQTSTPSKSYYHEMLKRSNMSVLDRMALPGTPPTAPNSPDMRRQLDAIELAYGDSDTPTDPQPSRQPCRRKTKMTIAVCLLATILLLVILILSYMLYRLKTNKNGTSSNLDSNPTARTPAPAPISGTASPGLIASLTASPSPSPSPSLVSDTEIEATPIPSFGGTISPTDLASSPSPEYTLVQNVRNIILVHSPNSEEKLTNIKSSQYLAMVWIAFDPNFSQYSLPKIIQRWVLSVLFLEVSGYSGPLMGSNQFAVYNNWMSYTDECTWLTTSIDPICNEDGMIQIIQLEGLGLEGTIPTELSLLSDSLVKLHMGDNKIAGVIPTSVGLLSQLTRFQFTENELSGRIPTEIANLTQLEVLGLGRNLFTGTLPTELGMLQRVGTLGVEGCNLSGPIPSEIGMMQGLKFVSLTDNWLAGDVPTEMGNLESLSVFIAHKNALSGEIPKEICQLGSLTTLQIDCDVKCPCCTDCCRGCSKLSL